MQQKRSLYRRERNCRQDNELRQEGKDCGCACPIEQGALLNQSLPLLTFAYPRGAVEEAHVRRNPQRQLQKARHCTTASSGNFVTQEHRHGIQLMTYIGHEQAICRGWRCRHDASGESPGGAIGGGKWVKRIRPRMSASPSVMSKHFFSLQRPQPLFSNPRPGVSRFSHMSTSMPRIHLYQALLLGAMHMTKTSGMLVFTGGTLVPCLIADHGNTRRGRYREA